MKYTQIPTDTFQNLQLNAGVITTGFTPSTGTITDGSILGATKGGTTFKATPTFQDFGDDIDNCPKNMLELKKLEGWDVKLSGTLVAPGGSSAFKKLIAACDYTSATNKLTPRNDLEDTDFIDSLWWVGDYSDVNDGTDAGFLAIEVLNALSTGGFSLKSADSGKGEFNFEFTGHYSMDAQTTVPFNVYVKKGTEESGGGGGGSTGGGDAGGASEGQ